MDSAIQQLSREELIRRLYKQGEEISQLKSDLAEAKSSLAQMTNKGSAVPGTMKAGEEDAAGRKRGRAPRNSEVSQRGKEPAVLKTETPGRKNGGKKAAGDPNYRKGDRRKRVEEDFPRGNHNFTDLTGRRFGMLTAISPTKERSYKGSVMWLCKCDCGKEALFAQDGLVFGNYKSCGCNRYSGVKAAMEHLTFVDGTCVEWLEKRETRTDNTSGHTGVSPTKNGKWYAHIGMQGDRYHLGVYDTFEEAVRARECAKKILHESFTRQYHEWKERAAQDPSWAKENPFHTSRYGHEELRQMVRMQMFEPADD